VIMCCLLMAVTSQVVVIMEQCWSDNKQRKPKKFGEKLALHLQFSPRLCIEKLASTTWTVEWPI
jgi:hypothetical protein